MYFVDLGKRFPKYFIPAIGAGIAENEPLKVGSYGIKRQWYASFGPHGNGNTGGMQIFSKSFKIFQAFCMLNIILEFFKI